MVELTDQPQKCLPQDLLLNKHYTFFWLKQLLVEDSVKLYKCQPVFVSLGAGTVSIAVVMVIISY